MEKSNSHEHTLRKIDQISLAILWLNYAILLISLFDNYILKNFFNLFHSDYQIYAHVIIFALPIFWMMGRGVSRVRQVGYLFLPVYLTFRPDHFRRIKWGFDDDPKEPDIPSIIGKVYFSFLACIFIAALLFNPSWENLGIVIKISGLVIPSLIVSAIIYFNAE